MKLSRDEMLSEDDDDDDDDDDDASLLSFSPEDDPDAKQQDEQPNRFLTDLGFAPEETRKTTLDDDVPGHM